MEQIYASEWHICSLVIKAWKSKLTATIHVNFFHTHYYKHYHFTDSNTLNLKRKKTETAYDDLKSVWFLKIHKIKIQDFNFTGDSGFTNKLFYLNMLSSGFLAFFCITK